MSIANLSGGNVIINDLKVRNIDTPVLGQELTIGTVNAAPVTIGKLSSTVNFGGRILATFIDVNPAVGSSLFIGADVPTTGIQIGHGGVPINVPAGVITPTITRGGSVGTGTLDIGANLANTAITIGNTSAPIILFANSLTFPGTASPLLITETRVFVSNNLTYSGALTNPGGCNVSLYRLGNFVALDFKNLVTGFSAVAAQAITVVGAIPVDYRPTTQRTFIGMCIDNSIIKPAQINLFPNGAISIGELTTNVFTNAQPCQAFDFSFTYNILS